jgi:L-threonylcarbamoyladenylate synthase
VLIAFAVDQDGLAAVVDGGPVPGGVASTVVDLTATPARILREGPISRAQLAEVIEIG